MASISTDKKGNRRILFKHVDGTRRALYLGDVPMGVATDFKRHVELILVAMKAGQAIEHSTIKWLVGLSGDFHSKLVAHELVQPRVAAVESEKPRAPTLGEFTRAYIDGRTDVKPRTKINLEQTRKALIKFFEKAGPRSLESITPGDADDFRLALRKDCGDNTVRRRCGMAKQFFRAAVRRRLIQESPFADMKDTTVRANVDRQFFVKRETIQKVIDAAPNAEWRLMIALARYGGLRCPSEVLALRWDGINWPSTDNEHRGTIYFVTKKTEHHEGKESRTIPLFPVLLPYLRDAFDQAEVGSEFVVSQLRYKSGNLRTQFKRIIVRAGVNPWPKLWVNLRSSRQTELTKSFPAHVVCKWIGNSEAVANEHYLQVTDDDFARAMTVDGASTTQNPTQQVTEPDCTEPTDESDDTGNLVTLGVSDAGRYAWQESNLRPTV